MKLSQIPYISGVMGAAGLRVAALVQMNYATVSGVGMGAKVAAFWRDQATLLQKHNGHPKDGLFLGLAVPDCRIPCYKVLSYIRKARDAGNPQPGLQWEVFCDTLATLAEKGGAETPVTITVTKKAVYLANAGNAAAGLAKDVTGSNYTTATIGVTVSPATVNWTFEQSGTGFGVVRSGDGLGVTSTLTAGSGVIAIKAGGKTVEIPVLTKDGGVGTESIADLTVGESRPLVADGFINAYNNNAKSYDIKVAPDGAGVAKWASGVITGVGVGFTRVYGLVEYEDAPGVWFADRSGLDVNAAAGAAAIRNGVPL